MKETESIFDFNANLIVMDDAIREGNTRKAADIIEETDKKKLTRSQKDQVSLRSIHLLLLQGQIEIASRRIKVIQKRPKDSLDPSLSSDLAMMSTVIKTISGQSTSAIEDIQNLIQDPTLNLSKNNAARLNLACILRDIGQWNRAIALLSQLVSDTSTSIEFKARAALVASEIHMSLELDQMSHWSESVIEFAAKSGAWQLVKSAEIMRTLDRFRTGDMANCQREFNQHLIEADQLNAIHPRILARLAITEFLIYFGSMEEAQSYLEESKNLIDAVNLSGLTSLQTLHEILWIETTPWRSSRDAAFEALDRLEIILAVISKYPRLPGVAPVWLLMGRVQASIAALDTARKSLMRAQMESQKLGSNRLEARSLFELAKIEWTALKSALEIGGSDRNKVLSISSRALDCAIKAHDVDTEWMIHAFRAQIYIESNEQYPSTGELETATTTLMQMIQTIGDPEMLRRFRNAEFRIPLLDLLEPHIRSQSEHQSPVEKLATGRVQITADETIEDVRRLQELIRALSEIHSSVSIPDLISKLLRSAITVIGSERSRFIPISSVDPENSQFSKVVSDGDLQSTITIPKEWLREIRENSDPIIYSRQPSESDTETRTVICASLITSQPIGILYLDRPARNGHFTNADLGIMRSMLQTTSLTYSILAMRQRLAELTDQFRREIVPEYPNIIGQSPAMKDVFNLIHRVSATDISVLITGETGSGKDLIARTIHESSSRKAFPFVYLDCSAIPVALIEAELFGIEKGVATGVEQRVGLLEYATGGTIVLDEITEIPLSTQAKLLRVLQEREFEPVGSNRTVQVDIRVVSTTSRDILKAISDQRIREDFYYRLNGITIDIPPLRQRQTDILLLARTFLQRYNAEFRKSIRGFSPTMIDALLEYPWNGNVRELDHTIRKAVLFCKNDEIGIDDLDGSLSQYRLLAFDTRIRQFETSIIIDTLRYFENDRYSAAQALGINIDDIDSYLDEIPLKQREEL